MKVADIMSRDVQHCRTSDNLERAAQLMWELDLGALPVVDDHGHPVAMVTDRDVCMAAYTQGRPLHDIPIVSAASHGIHCVGPDDPVERAENIMKVHRIRRVPVLDAGGNLVGMVGIADMIHHVSAWSDVAEFAATLSDVFRPHDRLRFRPQAPEGELQVEAPTRSA
jgi:CBS-domain-containing membrane protein